MEKRNPLKRVVLAHLGRMKGGLALAVLCTLGVVGLELLAPWPLKVLFDHILLEKPLSSALAFLDGVLARGTFIALATLAAAIVLIALGKAACLYFQVFQTSRIGYQLVFELRRELFQHLQSLSLSYHNRARAGELLNRITTDTHNLRDTFTESALAFGTHLLIIMGMFVVMFILNWRLTLIAAVTFPLLLVVLMLFYARVKATVKKQRRREGKMAARLGEVFATVPLARAFGRDGYDIAQFETESSQYLEESIRALRLEAAAIRATEIISAFGLGATVFYGALQVLAGHMTPGELLVFAAYTSRMYSPVRQVAKLLLKFNKAAVSAERLSEILNEEPEIPDRADAIEAHDLKGEIRFEHVCFDYAGGDKTLNDISFSVAPGQRLVLVGASGAGKSTMVNLLLRLYEPTRGAIFVDGHDIRDYRRESLRREIGIVLQDNVLLGASVRENIAYGKLLATPEEIEAAACAAHAHEFIMGLSEGYDTLVGERGATLSGGQRQRIGLARALIKRPSILILDEPTSALDAGSEALIQEVIERLQQDKTTILIAHHFRYIKDTDHVLVLKQGVIVEQGKAQELLAMQGHYYDLYAHQESDVHTRR